MIIKYLYHTEKMSKGRIVSDSTLFGTFPDKNFNG